MATQFVSDSFTEASDLVLSSHAPAVGGTWVEHPSYTPDATVSGSEDRVFGASGTSSSVYYNDAVPGEADYYVQAVVRRTATGSTGRTGVVARLASGANTGYFAYWTGTQWQLDKIVSGVTTTLDTDASTFTTNTDYTLKLSVDAGGVSVFLNGVVIMSSTDTAITAAGFAGLLVRSAGRVDDFDATTLDASPGIRDTQEAILVLTRGDTNLRGTQTAILVLGKENPLIRATQEAVLVLAKEIVQPRITQAAILVLGTHTPCVTKRCICWKITRLDGQVFGFTTHDEAVTFMGVSHIPCRSLSASAVEQADRGGGSMEMTGIISSSSITEDDLYSGKYDGASVEVWLVPWGDLTFATDSPRRLTAGVIGAFSHKQSSFRADALTAGARLQQRPLLRVYSPSCRWKLGDSRCQINLGNLTVSGTVTGVSSPRDAVLRTQRRKFVDASRGEAVGYFDQGTVTFTSGANNGRTAEIKAHTSTAASPSGGEFVLWAPLLDEIQVGDTYTAAPGCDKKKQTCIDKFDNFLNFGGFPDIPGTDAIIQTPNAKVS